MSNSEEGVKKIFGFPGGVSCSTGYQGSRPCTVLSFLQELFNSRKEASIFLRTCSCVLCRQIADYEAQNMYLVYTSLVAALLLQVLLMEITETEVQLLWVLSGNPLLTH